MTMSKKAKTTVNAKRNRKRSTPRDLSAKSARAVKGGNRPTPASSFSFEKFRYEYKEQT
jgi:hypothetical protein